MELLLIAFENIFWIIKQTIREFFLYGGCLWWYKLRLSLMLSWLGSSPNAAVLRYFKQHAPQMLQNGHNLPDDCGDLTYGETLPGTAYALLKLVGASKQTKVVDLGCGRGVVPLTAALAFDSEAVGIDIVADYIKRGQRAVSLLGLKNKVSFAEADFSHHKLPAADIYFLTSVCLDSKTWAALQKNLLRYAPRGAKVISVSRELSYPGWEICDRLVYPFTWDEATVYIYHRIGD